MDKQNSSSLKDYAMQVFEQYFEKLDGEFPTNLYNLVIKEIEAPLIQATLNYTQNNQCKTAQILGISRGTLRKKISKLKKTT